MSELRGMLKTYELSQRHFGWERLPAAAKDTETGNYLLDRALRAQGLVSYNECPTSYAVASTGVF